MSADPRASARFLGAFFDELCLWGLGEVVVSPGSRSTPLAMCAFELSRRQPQRLRLFVDVDERGAAFFALGLAKASGRAAALVCTSGTAVANYYPAVLEAESSRIPLVVLTGDRPPLLQGLGAPQTCDQLNAYGAHVRAFRQMPLPSGDAAAISFARQAAREACIAAGALPLGNGLGEPRLAAACTGGPVHLNFPFDEPLKPELSAADLFETGRREELGEKVAAGPPTGFMRPQGAPEPPGDGNAPGAGSLSGAAGPACAASGAFRSQGAAEPPVDGSLSGAPGAESPQGAPEPQGAAGGVLREPPSIGGPACDEEEASCIGNEAPEEPQDSRGSACAPPACAVGAASLDVSRETFVPVTQNIATLASRLAPREAARVAELLAGRRTLVLAGEGSCNTFSEAREVLSWAADWSLPLIADPLSGLRSADDDLVIDNYDSVLGPGGAAPRELVPEAVVRFGRYPVSKKATSFVEASGAVQLVVDVRQTRDFNYATDCYYPCAPIDFVRSFAAGPPGRFHGTAADEPGRHGATAADEPLGSCRVPTGEGPGRCCAPAADPPGMRRAPASADPPGERRAPADEQASFASAWVRENEAARRRIEAVDVQKDRGKGAFVRRLLGRLPEGSCLFAANSLSIRVLDTFYLKGPKRLTVLCNRGLNGIDGTLSTALGAAQHFAHTAVLTGDLALLHDLNALALQRELRLHREAEDSGSAPGRGLRPAPTIVVVLLNNKGGGIFDLLPQRSDEPYFERLFLTPQEVDFGAAAAAFGVPYARADTVESFDAAFGHALGVPGISLLEVPVPLGGLTEHPAPCRTREEGAPTKAVEHESAG